jgi:poly-gamma-glutamate capsule biosynthesis protein CapA/YwtB (metallophosphatase superfamily)
MTPLTAVAGFRSELTSTDATQLGAILSGSDKTYAALELTSSDATPILEALGLPWPSESGRLILAPTADALAADLAKHADRLGVVRASQVGPSVRALGWQGKSLFGVDRVSSLAEWPLQAQLSPAVGSSGADASASPASAANSFDPGDLWTVAAGGDVMLDRGVYKVVKIDGKGIDFPWNGGQATITARRCCTVWDWVYPIAKRTNTQPLVKQMLSGADISVINLEGPAPVNATYHTSPSKIFTFQQSFLPGMKNAGIDVVSLANNHIGNAGSKGINQTLAALDKLGIAHTGAGGTAAIAAQPAMFTVAGVKVAVIGVSAFPYALAAQLSGAPAEIKAARAAGAQVVIVYPHWGVEYKTTATSSQRTWAHRLIDAGADVVIGNHVHYVAGMEVYKGKPIWYALGNFIFDQNWSELTEEGLLLELTFDGTRLVQAWVHPLLIMDNAQPNFLDAVSGRPVLDQMYKASGKYLPW